MSRFAPRSYLSQNEIDAASLIAPDVVNVQRQRRIDWPADPVVARAYLDQLTRTNALSPERAEALKSALDQAARVLAENSRNNGLADQLEKLAAELDSGGAAASGRDQMRLQALTNFVSSLAGNVR